jgi:hypothetical protein
MLGLWTLGGAPLHITTTDPTRQEYGTESFEAARMSLTRLGYLPKSIRAEQIRTLPPGSSLVLPAVYVIPARVAEDLEWFVKQGGRLLIIDGPVKSMHLDAVRRITGFAQAGRYIHRDDVIQSTGRSPLVPKGTHQIDPLRWKYRMERWAEFRKEGINELVRDVYRRAKRIKPQAQVTAAVFSSPDAAASAYQDWPRWLRDKIIDFVIPMAYTEDMIELQQQIARWSSIDRRLERIVPGLSIYQKRDGKTTTRNPDLIRRQQELCRRQGARGNVFFSIQYLSDPVIDLFRTEFYPDASPRPVPAPRPTP